MGVNLLIVQYFRTIAEPSGDVNPMPDNVPKRTAGEKYILLWPLLKNVYPEPNPIY